MVNYNEIFVCESKFKWNENKNNNYSDNYSKYKFKFLLTKDRGETSSLEYIIITNYTVSFFYYADNCYINRTAKGFFTAGL